MFRSAILILVFSHCVAVFGYRPPEQCRSCNLEECLPIRECLVGLAKDVCGCCDVCAKSEFELCDHPQVPHSKPTGFYGRCGQDLECKIRTDLSPGQPPEAICYCRFEDEVCGSDNTTYDNICQMRVASIIKRITITQAKKGPCHRVPVIVTPPENTKNVTGSNIAILCEARGYPIPNIEWTWTRVDGKVFVLPSDDLQISINMRGGPEKWQVTGWLQIIDLKKEHEGDYTCIASNDAGFERAFARVNVVNSKEGRIKY